MLTDQEVLKMDEKAYMCEDQESFFRHKLLEMKQEAQDRLTQAREVLSSTHANSDPLDDATDEEIRDITLIRIARDTKVYHEIEDALDRLHNHEYGYCLLTGDVLGIPRLLANPLALYTTQATSTLETFGKGGEGVA